MISLKDIPGSLDKVNMKSGDKVRNSHEISVLIGTIFYFCFFSSQRMQYNGFYLIYYFFSCSYGTFAGLGRRRSVKAVGKRRKARVKRIKKILGKNNEEYVEEEE